MSDTGTPQPNLDQILANMPAGAGQQYSPPPRLVFGQVPGGRGGYTYYRGGGLVDENNRVALPGPYEISDAEVRRIYSSMSPEARAQTFAVLQRKGFYGSRTPGVFDNDLYAIESWLDYSNTMGITRGRALLQMQRELPDRGGTGGSARRYRVSNPDDLKTALNKAAMDTIGRSFTDQELQLTIRGYQQAEMNAQQQYYGGATTVTEAPSPETFAQQSAQFFAPNEANAYKFLGIMDRIFSATSGGM
jgi:hypothetical protein